MTGRYHRGRGTRAAVTAAFGVALATALLPGLTPAAAADTAPSPARSIGQKGAFNTGVPGQCTWGALNFWHAATGYYPDIEGNAAHWPVSASRHGWAVVDAPQPRSIVVFPPGVDGAAPFVGHAGWVDTVEHRPDGEYVHGRQGNGPGPTFVLKSVPGMSYILAP